MAYKDKSRMFEYGNQYNRENYDRVTVMLPKGDGAELKRIAAEMGISVGEYIRGAIKEKRERDG